MVLIFPWPSWWQGQHRPPPYRSKSTSRRRLRHRSKSLSHLRWNQHQSQPPSISTLPAAAQQHAAAVPPLAFHWPLHQDPAAPHGFSCKECNRWFETHQGLGGHVAGHKNRKIAAAAATAIAAGVDPIAAGGPRPEKLHTCKVCGEVYTSGVQLGGHMRKHYTGKPIVPRKRARLLLPPDHLGLAIPGQGPQAPATEVAAQPPQRPAVPAGCLRIFGVTIMQEAKEEDPPVAVEDKQ